MEQIVETPTKRKRNLYISYIKGAAMLGIVLVHLINWSNIPVSLLGRIAKETLHSSLFLFVLTTGSVIVIAYEHRTSLRKTSLRLLSRAGELLFLYYLYNVVKFFVFDFSTQPFYLQFIEKGAFTLQNILSFKSFAVPITILPTYSFLLALSPLALLAGRKLPRHKKTFFGAAIAILFAVNYLSPLPSSGWMVSDFLYANGYSIISVMLWLLPFLIGVFLAHAGFEKYRRVILTVGAISTSAAFAILFARGASLFPSDYQFPLGPYLIAFSLLMLSFLIYGFRALEASENPKTKKFLAAMRFIGDRTLRIYLIHWIIIDLTILLFPSHTWLIWLSVSAYLAIYLLMNRAKLAEYRAHQEHAARDMTIEIS